MVGLLQAATPGQAEKVLFLLLSAAVNGNDGDEVKMITTRRGKKLSGVGNDAGAAAARVSGREARIASVVDGIVAALGGSVSGDSGGIAPLASVPLPSYVGLFSAPVKMAEPNQHHPVSGVKATVGHEPPPWGNNSAAALLAKLAELEPRHVHGVAVAHAYCAMCRQMAAYDKTYKTNEDRWAAWAAEDNDWKNFAAGNADVCKGDVDTWQKSQHAVSRNGRGSDWVLEQIKRLQAEETQRPITLLMSATYAGINSKWMPVSHRKIGAYALSSPDGVTVPMAPAEVAAMIRSIAEACQHQLYPPGVVLAMCQAQKVKTCLDSEPPKHRISVAYFDGAHPSDLLPFTSALLVACSGDTGKFASLYNESLPALLAMDEEHGGFEVALIGKYKHVAWQSA